MPVKTKMREKKKKKKKEKNSACLVLRPSSSYLPACLPTCLPSFPPTYLRTYLFRANLVKNRVAERWNGA
jgi:hypothetical protein